MSYQVKSRVQFPRMRELFLQGRAVELSGGGDFAGTFHLFKGGHELSGDFARELAGLYDYRFPELYGSLRWNRNVFDVTDAGSKFWAVTRGSRSASRRSESRHSRRLDSRLRMRTSTSRVVRLLRAPRPPLRRPCERTQPARMAHGPFQRTHAAMARWRSPRPTG